MYAVIYPAVLFFFFCMSVNSYILMHIETPLKKLLWHVSWLFQALAAQKHRKWKITNVKKNKKFKNKKWLVSWVEEC